MRYTMILLTVMYGMLACGVERASEYDGAVQSVSDQEIVVYLNSICLLLGGHIGYEAVGRCGRCGGMTPCCNMQVCDRCAAEQGVCPFCLKKLNWTKNTDPGTEVPILLAILARSRDMRARQVAVYALTQIKEDGTLGFMMRYANEKMLARELSGAIGVFRDERYVPFLKHILQRYTSDDYFGEGDIEEQYYLHEAAQAAAASLALINSDKSIMILLHAAEHGKLWERVFAIRALARYPNDKEIVRIVLSSCLEEFFAKDEDWKWIPGRDCIGATLDALAAIGNRETALLVMAYMRDPGCDFLYQDLKECFTAIGQSAIPDCIAILRQDFQDGIFDWGRLCLVEAMGDIGDTTAVPFLTALTTMEYPDEYSARDFVFAAQQSLDKLLTGEPARLEQLLDVRP